MYVWIDVCVSVCVCLTKESNHSHYQTPGQMHACHQRTLLKLVRKLARALSNMLAQTHAQTHTHPKAQTSENSIRTQMRCLSEAIVPSCYCSPPKLRGTL